MPSKHAPASPRSKIRQSRREIINTLASALDLSSLASPTVSPLSTTVYSTKVHPIRVPSTIPCMQAGYLVPKGDAKDLKERSLAGPSHTSENSSCFVWAVAIEDVLKVIRIKKTQHRFFAVRRRRYDCLCETISLGNDSCTSRGPSYSASLAPELLEMLQRSSIP